MIMCDFCALSPVQRRTLVKKCHSLLNPGGAVLLDVYSMAAFNAALEPCGLCYDQESFRQFIGIRAIDNFRQIVAVAVGINECS